ncbi:hypothetical protein B0H21DRAFT_81625 [Amylocystis lapponica]|nr:hypothetical protein B0H21DRAFT_81625 [Amylocystis lapponica]
MGFKANGDLARLFGNLYGFVDEISDVLRKTRNFSSTTEYLGDGRQTLAPSFGSEANLKENIRRLDEQLKILIAIANKELLKIPESQRDWDRVQACFLASSAAKPLGDAVNIPNVLNFSSTACFKFDGKPDPNLVQQVMNWWEDVAVPDEDIRKDTKIDIKDMAEIVARTGAVVSNFLRVFHAYERREKRVFDIGVLRYPDMDHPYFKIYRIELFAFSDCTRNLFHQTDTSGIRCVLTHRHFVPRDDFIVSAKVTPLCFSPLKVLVARHQEGDQTESPPRGGQYVPLRCLRLRLSIFVSPNMPVLE